MKTKKLTLTAIFLSLALILGIAENALPPVIPVMPYAKIGIANCVTLLAVLLLGNREALLIVVLRACITAVFQGNVMALAFSLSAGVLSYAVTLLLLKVKIFSLPCVSAVSAVTHNTVQVCVAAVVTSGSAVFVYLPFLAVLGAVFGACVGLLSFYIVKLLRTDGLM